MLHYDIAEFAMTALSNKRLKAIRVADLEILCAVAECKSFVAAAHLLGTTPSSVTRAVQSLERIVEQTLIGRSQHFVSLTPAGEAYYEGARSALKLIEAAGEGVRSTKDEATGWVRFSAPSIMEICRLPGWIAEFTKRHPKLKLDILYTDESLDPSQAGLDFAIRGSVRRDSSLIGTLLWHYERYLCASPDYIRRNGNPATPDELSNHTMLRHTGPRILQDWYLVSENAAVPTRMEASHRVSSGAALMELVRAGVGIGRLASWVADPLIEHGDLVRLFPASVVRTRSGTRQGMRAVYQGGKLSPQARLVVDSLKCFGKSLKQ
jgi:DNA-binding transcriptional LysR family regulator